MQVIRNGVHNEYIEGNEINNSLMRFFVKLNLLSKDDNIICQLSIYENSRVVLIYNFDTLEEALYFCYEIVNKCEDKVQIIAMHNEFCQRLKLDKKYRKN